MITFSLEVVTMTNACVTISHDCYLMVTPYLNFNSVRFLADSLFNNENRNRDLKLGGHWPLRLRVDRK